MFFNGFWGIITDMVYYSILIELFFIIVGGNALSVTVSGITVRLSEIFALWVGLCLLVSGYRQKTERSVKLILLWGLLSFFLIFLNVLIYGFSLGHIVEALLYLFRFVYFLFIAYMAARYVCGRGRLTQALKFVNLCYIAVCLIGYFQLFFYPSALEWYAVFEKIGVHFSGDPHVGRLVSTDFDPNYLSSCLLVGITVNFYLLRQECRRFAVNRYAVKRILIFFFYVLTILLTKSRSGILGLAVLLAYLYISSIDFRRVRIRDLVTVTAVVLVGGYLIFFSDIYVFQRIRSVLQDPSALSRFSSWGHALKVFWETGFIGLGYNLYPAYQDVFYAVVENNARGGVDSSLLMVLITTGLVGFILFAAHIVAVWKQKNARRYVRALILAALIICNFNNLLFYSIWVFPFYFAVYLILGNKPNAIRNGTGATLLEAENRNGFGKEFI